MLIIRCANCLIDALLIPQEWLILSGHLANDFVVHRCLLTHRISTIHDHHFPQTYINLSERSEVK